MSYFHHPCTLIVDCLILHGNYILIFFSFVEASLQKMSAHRRLKRKNNDGEYSYVDSDNEAEDAAKLMSLLHRYARENLLLANIYIKVIAVLSFFAKISILDLLQFNRVILSIVTYIIKMLPKK